MKKTYRIWTPLVVIVLTAVLFYCFKVIQVKEVIPALQQTQKVDEGDCPPDGLTREVRLQDLNRLKNRSTFPALNDFDKTITLEKMLQPGYDQNRFNSSAAVEVTGYVADVKAGGIETCNCKAKDPNHRDTHIELVLNPMSFTNTQKVIVEVTPRIRNTMLAKGEDWNTRALRDKILGRWIKAQGWLLFDFEHAHQAENTNPGNEKNWRATSWEVHPVTAIEVVNRPR